MARGKVTFPRKGLSFAGGGRLVGLVKTKLSCLLMVAVSFAALAICSQASIKQKSEPELVISPPAADRLPCEMSVPAFRYHAMSRIDTAPEMETPELPMDGGYALPAESFVFTFLVEGSGPAVPLYPLRL